MTDRWILINRPSVVRTFPKQFWNPSPGLLRRLHPPSNVQLRLIQVDPKKGAQFWDSESIWVRLTRVGWRTWTGAINVSDVEADGYQPGQIIKFSPDHVFDLCEFDESGDPLVNRGKAAFVRGKDTLLGLTYLHADGSIDRREQLHGVIDHVDTRVIAVRIPGQTDLFTLPPDLRSIQPAPPGTYRLRSSGLVIEDPTFICTWTIGAPSD